VRGEKMRVRMNNLVSVSDVSKNTSAMIAKAAAGETQVVLNHNKPVAAIIDIELYEKMLDLMADIEVTQKAISRLNESDEGSISLEELIVKYNIDLSKE
jgi:prevent-host-death family protein